MPQPPKPGVIPLAPLAVGDILGGGFSALGRNRKPLLGMAAAIFLSAGLLIGTAFGIAAYVVFDHVRALFDLPPGTEPDSGDTLPLVGAFAGAWLASFVIAIVAMALMNAACLVVVQDAVLGLRPSFGEVWRRSSTRIPAMLGAQFLVCLMVAVPFLLLALVPFAMALTSGGDDYAVGVSFAIFFLGLLVLGPVALWLYVRYSLAPAAVVFEGQGPAGALRRSAELVRGAWWRTLGIQLLVMIIAGTIGYVISIPFTYGGMFSAMAMIPHDPAASEVVGPAVFAAVLYLLGMVISQFISIVLPQLSIGLLYVDRRIRVENLAPTLAEAAGVQPPPPPYSGQPYPGQPYPGQPYPG
ncbi:hypothetical protein U9R90_24210 [Streptomyces sp. E11-3]